jgi:hypothetical protein
MLLKAGTKLHSAVCDTDIMVIKGAGDIALCCGGVSMVASRNGISGQIDPAQSGGTTMGKRYQTVDGAIELLCIKPGKGTLTVDGVPLEIKAAKALPSSD